MATSELILLDFEILEDGTVAMDIEIVSFIKGGIYFKILESPRKPKGFKKIVRWVRDYFRSMKLPFHKNEIQA